MYSGAVGPAWLRCELGRMRLLSLIILGAMCSVGCDPVAHETITVRLPVENEAHAASNALSLIRQVLAKHDFHSNSISPQIASNHTSLVAAYADAVEPHLGCFIYHRRGEVFIEFNQLGRYQLSSSGIGVRDDLRKVLSESLGNARVTP